jgi:hypothetical protein
VTLRDNLTKTAQITQQFNIPDTTLGEQTWPTLDDEAAAAHADVRPVIMCVGRTIDTCTQAEEARRRNQRRLVPFGTSAYQAAWILDDYGNADDDDDENDANDDDAIAVDDVEGGGGGVDDAGDVDSEELLPLDEADRMMNAPTSKRRGCVVLLCLLCCCCVILCVL